MGDFALGFMTSALEPDELITRVSFDAWPQTHGWGFEEYARRHGDFAIASAGVLLTLDARGAISVTERAAYIGRIRNLARNVAQSYVKSREALGYPMAPKEWVTQLTEAAV